MVVVLVRGKSGDAPHPERAEVRWDVNAITLWNTVYLDRILARLRADGLPVLDEDVARLHPYWYKHINVHGHYAFYPPTPGGEIGSRPLRDPDRADDDDR